MSRNSWFNDPTLQVVRPGEFVRPGGQITPHDFGTALSVGSSLLGASMQADSAGDAANAQSQAAAGSIAEQRRQYDLNRSDLAPWRNAGGAAINRLSALLGLDSPGAKVMPDGRSVDQAAHDLWQQDWQNDVGGVRSAGNADPNTYKRIDPTGYQSVLDSYTPKVQGAVDAPDAGSLLKKFTVEDFYNDPVTKLGLDFGLSEGTKALDRMAGARGMRNSGATLKDLTRFATDYTGTKAGESQNRFVNDQTNLYNRLAGVAGTGQNAANTTASLGTQTAGNISNTMTSLGNARGAASIAQGNAFGNGLNTIGNWWNQQSTLNRLFPQSTGGNSYNMAGAFQPYYSGYGSGGDYQYG